MRGSACTHNGSCEALQACALSCHVSKSVQVCGLQIGPKSKLSNDEAAAHFALWAILKAPLIISVDLKCAHAQDPCGASYHLRCRVASALAF